MIYLRFAISGASASEALQRGTAEFMFQSDDARECTRQAVALLRARDCKALGIDHAWEGFAPEDFPSDERSRELFGEAQEQGMSFHLELRPTPSHGSPRPNLAFSYAAGLAGR
jgi:hypothetical protein